MLKIVTGDDRVATQKAIKRELGANYEIFEGENLTKTDLLDIFRGTSLFGTGQRRILLKDLSENAEIWNEIEKYLDTEHLVIIWETKLDKRSVVYKKLKAEGVEFEDFSSKSAPDIGLVFGIFDAALRDGARAVSLAKEIELTSDPYMFFGLLVTQALKKYQAATGTNRARWTRILHGLSELDIQMKTSTIEPWLLVEGFLLRMGKM